MLKPRSLEQRIQATGIIVAGTIIDRLDEVPEVGALRFGVNLGRYLYSEQELATFATPGHFAIDAQIMERYSIHSKLARWPAFELLVCVAHDPLYDWKIRCPEDFDHE